MNIPPFEAEVIDASRVTRGRLFDDRIEEDPWVLFHGTSASNSLSIENVGFQYTQGSVTQSDIDRINTVFEAMRWDGSDSEGYPLLKGFSVSDFHDSTASSTFFTECSTRALRYARRIRAGGEKLYGIRNAIADLQSYLTEVAVRDHHAMAMADTLDFLVRSNASQKEIELNSPPTVDLEWLAEQIHALDDLRRLAALAFDGYCGGVVYAVRLKVVDLEGMTYSAMGIKSRRLIPADRIVAKVNVPLTYEPTFPAKQDHQLLQMKMNSGLIKALYRQAIETES